MKKLLLISMAVISGHIYAQKSEMPVTRYTPKKIEIFHTNRMYIELDSTKNPYKGKLIIKGDTIKAIINEIVDNCNLQYEIRYQYQVLYQLDSIIANREMTIKSLRKQLKK